MDNTAHLRYTKKIPGGRRWGKCVPWSRPHWPGYLSWVWDLGAWARELALIGRNHTHPRISYHSCLLRVTHVVNSRKPKKAKTLSFQSYFAHDPPPVPKIKNFFTNISDRENFFLKNRFRHRAHSHTSWFSNTTENYSLTYSGSPKSNKKKFRKFKIYDCYRKLWMSGDDLQEMSSAVWQLAR